MKNQLKTLILSAALLCGVCAGCSPERTTAVSIKGDKFCINGVETFKGKSWRGYPIEGLLPNSRMVNATFDDLTDSTQYRWVYPDTKVWDAERNVSEFLENVPNYAASNLKAMTINLQGGSPQGYSQRHQPWNNSAIDPQGELRPEFMERVARVIECADREGMVIILGLYYFGQELYLEDEAAIMQGIKNSVTWVLERGYTNVMIEIANECNFYDAPLLSPERIHEAILYAQSIEVDGRRLLISTSYGGNRLPGSEVVKASDFILLHGNGIKDPDRIVELVELTKGVEGYRGQPIVFNEDDHFDFDKDWNNSVAATSAGASWGYFDYRKVGEPFEQGYQSIPADWGISSPRKRGFFSLLDEWSE